MVVWLFYVVLFPVDYGVEDEGAEIAVVGGVYGLATGLGEGVMGQWRLEMNRIPWGAVMGSNGRRFVR
jgi:hypothetical protein